MTKEEAVALLNKGRFREWNNYRKNNPDWKPELSNVDLSNTKLVFGYMQQFNLTGANLCGTNLSTLEHIIYDWQVADATKANIHKWVNDRYLPFRREYLDLKDSLIDLFTVFPNEFHPTEHGAIFVSVTSAQKLEAPTTHTVFISYAWTNEDVVLAIDQWLRLKGLKTRIDKRDFFAGSRIRDEIIRVMQECDAVIIFYSNESKDKPWTQFERELVSDLEMEAKRDGRHPPRIIYFVLDETSLPNATEKNRIAIMAKGKNFEVVSEELYYSILQIAKSAKHIDLAKWSDFTF